MTYTDEQIARVKAWVARVHERVHERMPGTDGSDDQGARAGCTWICGAEPAEVIGLGRRAAHWGHEKFSHPGTPKACQSPHDVICKAVWP